MLSRINAMQLDLSLTIVNINIIDGNNSNNIKNIFLTWKSWAFKHMKHFIYNLNTIKVELILNVSA